MDRKYRVLLIEDDAGLNLAISIILQNDFEVISADSIQEARLLLNCNPDLILSDIRLPGVVRSEFIYELKDKFVNIPIIAMSCLPDQEMTNELELAGIKVIRKPFTKIEIINIIKSVLI